MPAPHPAVTTRSRTITWQDPTATEAAIASMTGLAYLTALVDGRLPGPPIAALSQVDFVDAAFGRITARCRLDPSMYNPLGVVHGGVLCTLLDTVAACAFHSTLPAGVSYTSIEIKVNYLKAVRPATGDLTATGTVVKAGSRIGFAEATATDSSATVIATATSTLLVLPGPTRDTGT